MNISGGAAGSDEGAEIKPGDKKSRTSRVKGSSKVVEPEESVA